MKDESKTVRIKLAVRVTVFMAFCLLIFDTINVR